AGQRHERARLRKRAALDLGQAEPVDRADPDRVAAHTELERGHAAERQVRARKTRTRSAITLGSRLERSVGGAPVAAGEAAALEPDPAGVRILRAAVPPAVGLAQAAAQ